MYVKALCPLPQNSKSLMYLSGDPTEHDFICDIVTDHEKGVCEVRSFLL